MARQRKRGGWGLTVGWGGGVYQATLACVVIVPRALRQATEPPPVDCYAWDSPLPPPSCGSSDVFVLRRREILKRNQEEGKHHYGTVHVWPLLFTAALLFFCFMFSWQLFVMCGFENQQRSGIYILANFSYGFLTRNHILQFLSILGFLRLSAVILSAALQGFCTLFCSRVSSKLLNFPIFTRVLTKASHMSWSKITHVAKAPFQV